MATQKAEYSIYKYVYDRTPKNITKWQNALKIAEDPLWPNWSQLQNLYHDIVLDGHLTGVMEKRILNILNTPIVFQINGKENDAVTALIRSEAFELILRYMIESRFYGYSLCWVDITQPGINTPTAKLIDRRHVVPPLHIYKYRESDPNTDGIDYTLPPYPPYTLTAGREDDMGLLLKCTPYVIYKRGDVSDWATFAELFGMPLRKGKFPSHDSVARKELIDAMNEMGSAAAIAIPDSCDVEFIENKTTQSGKGVHETLADWCDRQISKIVLGNTMTTDAQGGNYKGEVHADDQEGIFEADRRFILRILNTQFKRLLELHGYNPGDALFKYVDEDSTPIKDRIDIDLKVNQAVEIPAEYWYDRYNMPMPKGGAKAREPQAAAVPPNGIQKLSEEPIRRGKSLFNFFD
jgi:hypothetical protein